MIIIKTIIIILNQPLLNSALKNVLSHHFNIVATSTNADDMIVLCEKYKPDLVLTDIITQNNKCGLINGKKIKEKYKNSIKILAITSIPEVTFLRKAKEYNFDGLIYKDIEYETLISCINQIIKGYKIFPDNYIHSNEIDYFKKLSNKEIEILKMLCHGYERDYIAKHLNITTGTLKNYISEILNKMEFDNTSKLTMFCISNGFIVPDNDTNYI